MHTFKDNEGRPWTVAINIATAKRVKAATNGAVDLYSAVSDGLEALGKLLSDVLTLVDVIYLCCEEQAQAKNVSDVDFGRAMAGDVIEKATDAFLKALIDFFPDPRTRKTLATVIEKAKAYGDQQLNQAVELVENLDIESLLKSSKSSSGNSPASSASTPAA